MYLLELESNISGAYFYFVNNDIYSCRISTNQSQTLFLMVTHVSLILKGYKTLRVHQNTWVNEGKEQVDFFNLIGKGRHDLETISFPTACQFGA